MVPLEIQKIGKNIHKQNITFKTCESLYCTPVSYTLIWYNYTSIKKMLKKKKQNSKALLEIFDHFCSHTPKENEHTHTHE